MKLIEQFDGFIKELARVNRIARAERAPVLVKVRRPSDVTRRFDALDLAARDERAAARIDRRLR